MLVYSTKFEVNDNFNIETFMCLIKEWLTHPNSKTKFPDFEWDGKEEFIIKSLDGCSTLYLYVLIEQNTIAAKLNTVDQNNIEWDNYYSLVNNELYIELQKHAKDSSIILNNKYHLPYTFHLLHDKGYIRHDETKILNSGTITYVSLNENFDFIKNIILRNTTIDLPVVYVSYKRNGIYSTAVNIDALRNSLLGMAYVVVEKDKETSVKLSEETSYSTPYLGAIQICFPNGFTKRFIPNDNIPEYIFRNEIVNYVFDRTSQFKINEKFTISYITNRIHKIRIDNLERNKSDIETLQEEKSIYENYISEIESENAKLKADIYSYQMQCASLQTKIDNDTEANILSKGNIRDLYENEIFDCIYDILEDVHKNTNPESRQYEILCELLNNNKENYKNSRKSKIVEFEKIMKESRNLAKRQIQKLENMGLHVFGDNHPKIRFPNGKQIATLGSTTSDCCDAENAKREFIKLL